MSSVSDSKAKNVAATKEEERLQQSHQARKKNTQNAQKAEIDEERSKHKENVAVMRDRHTSEINKEKSTRQKIKENHNKLLQENYKKTAEERARHEAAIKQQRSQLQEKQKSVAEQEHGLEARKREEMQKSMSAYNQHMDEMHTAQKTEAKEQKDAHRSMVAEDQKTFQDYRKDQREFYEQEIQKEKSQFKEVAQSRRGDYDVELNKNELNYQLVLEEQKNKYQDHFEEAKYKHLDAVKKYEEPKKDPFYRVQDLGAKVEDMGTHYELKLEIPEHEIRNFKVNVKSDKIMVAGARRHEEELKFEHEKLSTNNYQTIKQEFALNNPVDEAQVQREYKDGVLNVFVPKKGFGIF